MPNLHNRQVGKLGEDLAASYLKDKGYILLFRNFRNRWDEIDIIAQKNDKLVFIEVKTKVGLHYGQPYEAVGPYKLRSLHRAIQYFLLQKHLSNTKLSLDVVSIVLKQSHEVLTIKYFENILPIGQTL